MNKYVMNKVFAKKLVSFSHCINQSQTLAIMISIFIFADALQSLNC